MRTVTESAARWVLLPLAAICAFAAGGDLRIITVIRNHDRAALQTLLMQGLDVNAAQDDGATALQWAAHEDDLESADLLIHAGANTNSANELGVTALSLACMNRNAAMVAKLLEAGANANASTVTGETVLMTCARTGQADAVKALLAHGANPNARETSRGQTALMWAVAQSHPDVVQLLIAGGADINAKSRPVNERLIRDDPVASRGEPGSEKLGPGEFIETGGSTPLMFAARSGDLKSARSLVAAGAKINDAEPDGNTPLVVAAHSGHGALASFLLDKDALPNSDGAGYTALHAAVLRGDAELVKALLGHGANPNVRITKGTPVIRSAQDFVLPAYLTGATPYFLAAKFGETEIMRALAAAGADTRAVTRDGTSPLMAATGIGWRGGVTRRGESNPSAAFPEPDDDRTLATVQLALDLGSDVNAANAAGDTALHGAAAKGYPVVVKLLVANGAQIDPANKRGQTPLAIVMTDPGGGVSYGRPPLKETERVLRQLGAKELPKPVAAQPPKNLQVLKDAAAVRPTMAAFTSGLGVQCTFCHAEDRASDANPHKITARVMMGLVNQINARFPAGNARVSCYTCHRGEAEPKMTPPQQ